MPCNNRKLKKCPFETYHLLSVNLKNEKKMCLIPAVDFTNGTLGAIYFLFLQEMAEFISEDPNLHHYINKTLFTL